MTSGEVIETPFSALRTSSSARLLFSPVSFSLLFSWFHLPSNNVVSNTIHVYRQRDKNPEDFEEFFAEDGMGRFFEDTFPEEKISGRAIFGGVLNGRLAF